jgi:hypothetical protein
MAADDVAHALMAMDDDDVRSRVAGGDLSAFAHLDLDDAERALVQSAAEEADVEGFSFQCNFMPAISCNEINGKGFNAAVNYAKNGASANLAPSFNQWTAVKNAQGGW